MTDRELMSKFRAISSSKQITHTTKLSDLKKKIESDILVNEALFRTLEMNEDDKNLQFVNTCIDKLQGDKLTREDMEKLNLLNKKYLRRKNWSE